MSSSEEERALSSVLLRYGVHDGYTIETLKSGLIHSTWKVTGKEATYVVQKVNDNVFRKPFDIASNLQQLKSHLDVYYPEYLFIAPVTTADGKQLVHTEGGYYRALPFVKDSHTIDVVSTPEQAYEAALQFSKFTWYLRDFPSQNLHSTIPNFHNLGFRYQQFEDALRKGNEARIKRAADLISEVKKHAGIVETWDKILAGSLIRTRVTHHDTKISNVLFSPQDKGICVIDLDTVMPGFFISDIGDMMRTYLSPASEESTDFTTIEVREEYFRAIAEGYLEFMGQEMNAVERSLFVYSGFFLIYMQAIRFLADYCNDDVYYGARYPEHNYMRAANQMELLAKLKEKESLLEEIVQKS